MEVTGCISIWVKNLVNVANMAGWARGNRTARGGRGARVVGASLQFCLLIGQCAFHSPSLSQVPLTSEHVHMTASVYSTKSIRHKRQLTR